MRSSKSALTLSVCAIGIALSCATLFAEETITIDNVRQRTPWNGLVDIDYTIAGVTGDPNDYQIMFTMTVDGKSFVASNFWDAAWCDHATANGKQRATWNARADGIAEKTDVDVKARIIYAPVTDSSAEFAIVDLSAGASATSVYPVRYVAGDTTRTAQFNIDTYKTRKIVLKKVHAGEFWMGDGNVSEGTKRHRVRLTQDYFLGLFEVTQEQYSRVCGDTTIGFGYFKPEFGGKSAPGEDVAKMPANNMWYDKVMSTADYYGGIYGPQYHCFMKKLNERTVCRGQKVGLFAFPTEAQWEFACRAGTETVYYWGDDVADYADYAWTPDNGYTASGVGTSLHEVGLLKPNAWGFYDMSGNIQEMCEDFYDNYPAYSETEVTVDPTGAAQAEKRSVRGGSHWHSRSECASGARSSNQMDGDNRTGYGYISYAWGFRLSEKLRVIQ